jgi:hypothetical protein
MPVFFVLQPEDFICTATTWTEKDPNVTNCNIRVDAGTRLRINAAPPMVRVVSRLSGVPHTPPKHAEIPPVSRPSQGRLSFSFRVILIGFLCT